MDRIGVRKKKRRMTAELLVEVIIDPSERLASVINSAQHDCQTGATLERVLFEDWNIWPMQGEGPQDVPSSPALGSPSSVPRAERADWNSPSLLVIVRPQPDDVQFLHSA